MSLTVKITGIQDIKEALAGIVPKLRRRALRNALAAGARVVRDRARSAAPVLSTAAPAVRRGWRTPGLLRKQIVVRTSKVARRAGDVGVFVNVRPAKGPARGTYSPLDPYYWRWQEFGTVRQRGIKYLQAGAGQLEEALRIFVAKIGPAIDKLNKPKAPAP
jgi:HK97 gp10 family phage protein